MPHYGILREYKFEDIDDVRGSEVHGVNDEKLGTIDDVVFNHATGDIRYVVLKTGLIMSKKIMVPANRIEPYGNHEDKFYAELDKERLKMLPEFNDAALKSEGDWSIYEKEYESRLNDGAVLYNKDTGRVVTPPTEQVEGARRTPLTGEARESLDRDFTPQRMGHQDELLGVAGSAADKTLLKPAKASIAGKEDVAGTEPVTRATANIPTREVQIGTVPLEGHAAHGTLDRDIKARDIKDRELNPPARATREITNTMGGDMEVPVEEPNERLKENMREPGIYRLEETPEQRAALGKRWSGFQDRLRSRRDKIIVDCPDCASQEKVA
jgi:sporulation protein YlmC with PRC-barrel domain